MKTLLLCGGAPNQIALANRLHAIHPLAHVAVIAVPPPKRRRSLVPRVVSYTVGRPLRRAWLDLMASYDREFRAAPDAALSRHVGVNACTVIELVKAEKPDLVLVSGTDLLHQELIDAIGKSAKIINLHTGLSPYLKGGPNCTNWALALGKFDLIGNTVMWLDGGIDSGNLIATERTPLTGRESLFELHRKVMDHAHELYGRCYAQAVAGNKLPSVPQARLASGRLFLSREWTGVQMLRALINFYLRYHPDPKLRPIELIGLETTPANEAKSARGGYRIAMLLPDLTLGGAERVSLDLAREFLRLGHEVDFVLMRKFGQLLQALPEGVEVVDLQATKMRHIARPLAAYLKGRKPDVLLANLWPVTTVAVATARLIRSKTRVITIDHSALSLQYKHWNWPTWAALRASIALVYPLANARIAVSQGVAQDVGALGWRGPDFLKVIFNPVPTPVFNQQAQEAAKRAWGGWDGPKLITVGALKEEKDHATLLKAFKFFLQSRDARLLILGEGHLFAATAELARQLEIADKVIMPGANRYPGPFYASADLFVLSSNLEGLPTVLIEALACGVSVVSTDCKSGPAEILENGRYGLLTPVGDADALANAMRQALDAPHDRDALRRRAAEFSPAKAADLYLKLMFPEQNA